MGGYVYLFGSLRNYQYALDSPAGLASLAHVSGLSKVYAASLTGGPTYLAVLSNQHELFFVDEHLQVSHLAAQQPVRSCAALENRVLGLTDSYLYEWRLPAGPPSQLAK